MRWRVSIRFLRLGMLVTLILGGWLPVGGFAQTNTPFTVVATGLVNPRGFAFDDEGGLVVAMAGASGPTAGVALIDDAGCLTTIANELPSYRVVFGGPVGVADVAVRDGERYFLLAGGNIDDGGMVNGLYRIEEGGESTLIADVSTFIRDNPVAERPGDYDTDGQPYAMLAMDDAFWVTEGNSNQLLRLGLDGSVSRIADLSAGHPIPTGIAPAPNGGVYVAFFTAAPYREGAARVVEVAADGTVTEVWSGLTLVTALALGPDGSLYALEMATGIDPDDPASVVTGSGRVVRQTGPDSAEAIVTGLSLPVAMEFGADGGLFFAFPAFGADSGEGAIVRVDLAAGAAVAAPSELETSAQPTVCS
ncbi:MAG: ScyD/ScyE family protein [Chloroflexota bacterium]|nr:ScyD/ScyE family protein [Chloroflexota bacterium]